MTHGEQTLPPAIRRVQSGLRRLCALAGVKAKSLIFVHFAIVGSLLYAASIPAYSRLPTGGLTAQLALAKSEYSNREAVIATLRLYNQTTRTIRFFENFQPNINEYFDDGTSIPTQAFLNNAYSGIAEPWQERTLRPGEATEESVALQSIDVIEDPMRANAFADVQVRFGASKLQRIQTNVVAWTTISNKRGTFKFGDLGDDRPLYITEGEVDEQMVFPIQNRPRGASAASEAQRSSEALSLFDEAAPLNTLSLSSELAYEIGSPWNANATTVPIPRLPFLPLQQGTATGLSPNPYVRKYQDEQRLPPFPYDVGIRRVLAASGTGTAHLHHIFSDAPYERSYDEAVDNGYLNRFVPPPIRFEIDSDRTMIETVAVAPRIFALRLGFDAIDLSYIYATERARRIAAMLNTSLHASALVVPFGPAPQSQTIALAMTVQGQASVRGPRVRADPATTPSSTPRADIPEMYREPDYDRIDVPDETTQVSVEGHMAASAPADDTVLRIAYTTGNHSRAFSAGAIATLQRVLNATPSVERFRIDQPAYNRPAMLTIALNTTDPKRIKLVASALIEPSPELSTSTYQIRYFSTRCVRLDDEAVAGALAVAQANAEQEAGGRRLRKLVLVYVAPAGFSGGSCGGPLPPADTDTGGALEPIDSPQITAQVRVRLVYRTFASKR